MLKLSKKNILFRWFNGTVMQITHQKYMITSTETESPENFTLTAFLVLRLLPARSLLSMEIVKSRPRLRNNNPTIGHLQTISSREAKLFRYSPLKQTSHQLSVIFSLNYCTVKTKTNKHIQIKPEIILNRFSTYTKCHHKPGSTF